MIGTVLYYALYKIDLSCYFVHLCANNITALFHYSRKHKLSPRIKPHYKCPLSLISGILVLVYLFKAVPAWPPDTQRYHLSPGTPQGEPPSPRCF